MPADLHNPWILQTPETLLMAFEEGRVVRYRIRDGQVLYQADTQVPWVQLSPEQILQHVAIQTVVGEWLKNRKESRQWKLLA
jgi:hypothetical protein